ncbi:hypothetical protein MTR67_035804, partial [Solanum verrucosum]
MFSLLCKLTFSLPQSCINVALCFVSPENVGECIRLTEEFRKLPQDHVAKEDKLEILRSLVQQTSVGLFSSIPGSSNFVFLGFGKGDNLLFVPQVKKMIFHAMTHAVCELGMRSHGTENDVVRVEVSLSSLKSSRQEADLAINYNCYSVLDRSTRQMIGKGHESQGLYLLSIPTPHVAFTSAGSSESLHSQLGHPSLLKLQKMVPCLSSLSLLE